MLTFTKLKISSKIKFIFRSSVKQGWELLAIFLSFFAPSDRIVKYLEHFLIEFTLEDDNDEERESGGAGDRKGEESVLGLLSEGDGGQLDEDVLGITTTLEKVNKRNVLKLKT